MATGEYNYAVNQNVNSFHDRPSKELDVFLKLPMMSVRRVFEAPNDVYDLPRV
jgi:hypothetical protein